MGDSLLETMFYIVFILNLFALALGIVIFQSFTQEMRKNHDDHVRIVSFLDMLMHKPSEKEVCPEEKDEHPPSDKGKLYYNQDGKASYRAYNDNRKRQQKERTAVDEIEDFEREQV